MNEHDEHTIFMEVTPISTAPGPSKFTVTARTPRQPTTDPELLEVKQETADDTQDVRETFLSQIMGLSEPDDEQAGPAQPGEKIHCAECHYTTTDAERLLRHIRRVHRGLNPFQCYMCDYSTYNKVLFEEHVRIHRGIKPFKCSYCDYCSASKKNTKKHELIHRPDNPLRCPHCPFIARHHRALVCHRKTHSGSDREEEKDIEAPIDKCEFCGDTFHTRKALMNHHRKRRRCREPRCGAMMCNKAAYAAHMADLHNKMVQEKPKLHRCGVCEFSCNSAPRMLLHLIHHPNQSVDESVLDLTILRKYGIMT